MQLPPLQVIESWPAPNYVDPVTRGWANAVMNFVLYPLVCVALGIRVYTRLRISKSFGWDDWLILLSFFPTTAFMVISLLSEFKFGWNRHVWDVPLPNIILGMKIIISTQVLFTMGSTLTKCSMLALVYRIVSKTSGIFPRIVIGAIILVAVDGSLFCFMVVFQCRPVRLYWTLSPTPQPTCRNQTKHLLTAGCINTLTDFLTTLLPLPTVYNLKLPFRQAAIIFLLFAAGLLVTAAGAVRTYYTWRATSSYDATWDTWAVWLSSSVELYVGVMCASLPATKKFFAVYAPRILGSRMSAKSKQSHSGSWRAGTDVEMGVMEILPRPDSVAKRESRRMEDVRISIRRGSELTRIESVESGVSDFRLSREESIVESSRKIETDGTVSRGVIGDIESGFD